ncbi:MAG: hypothetical protein F6K24_54885, partial [Okeania sp. SIO2D1]|nr:hypothetical protein [Okeania sp. SIO2D1]
MSKVSDQAKFKKKGRDDSFPRSCYANTLDGSIPTPIPSWEGMGVGHIKLPRIGWINTDPVLPDNISPKSVTISR